MLDAGTRLFWCNFSLCCEGDEGVDAVFAREMRVDSEQVGPEGDGGVVIALAEVEGGGEVQGGNEVGVGGEDGLRFVEGFVDVSELAERQRKIGAERGILGVGG